LLQNVPLYSPVVAALPATDAAFICEGVASVAREKKSLVCCRFVAGLRLPAGTGNVAAKRISGLQQAHKGNNAFGMSYETCNRNGWNSFTCECNDNNYVHPAWTFFSSYWRVIYRTSAMQTLGFE
jgi:hypothetical protein